MTAIPAFRSTIAPARPVLCPAAMPSLQHEVLLLLFRNRPELAAELLRDALHLELPAYAEARVESAELTQVTPTEYRADLVVVLRVEGKPVLAIVVEVQLRPDPDKPYAWLAYLGTLHARMRCPVCLLVITADEKTAAWCRKAVDAGPGLRFEPVVLGPSAVPVVDDPAVAEHDPELAVLSVLAHGADAPDPYALGDAALFGLQHLTDEQQRVYSDVILAALPGAVRAVLEAKMDERTYVYQSDFAKRHQAKGRAEGEAKGLAEGEAKGLAEGRADAILDVLDARGLRVSDEARARIRACTDAAQLAAWVRKAATVASVDEIF